MQPTDCTVLTGLPTQAAERRVKRDVRQASLVERGYVQASFGGLPVLVGPELAAELKAFRQSRERRS